MLEAQIEARGLRLLGGFHPTSAEQTGALDQCETLLLVGWGGAEGWPHFERSPEMTDGAPDPLDRWTLRTVDALAAAIDARPLYPFGGPPWHPFQTWGLRAGIATKSPIGLLIHPQFGLWHSYRAALAFRQRLPLPSRNTAPSPCDSCADRPCLTACPVGAYSPDRFDVDGCRSHLRKPETTCRQVGCMARDACPAGRDYRYTQAQVDFHQRAFRRD
jgi:ferredoxin